MSLSWYSFTSLSGAIACLSLSAFTFLKLEKKSPHRWYSLSILGIGIWCIDSFALTSQLITNSNYIIHKFLFLGAYLSQIGYIQWARSIKTNRTKIENCIVSFLILSLIILYFLSFTKYSFNGINNKHFFSSFFRTGKFFFIFPIQCALCAIYGIFFLMRREFNASMGQTKTQLLYIIIISVVMYLAGLIYFLFVYNLRILPIADILVVVSNTVMSYAILRYQTLNIALKKTLIYSVVITIITIMYFLVIYMLEKSFSNITGYHSIPIAVTIITLFSIVFIPLKNKTQYLFDKYFFRGSIDQIDQENTKLREELQKSEKMKAVATLAAGMAHEIKNPLTSIKTFTEYIDKKQNDPDFINKFKEVVGPEVDRINHIVKQLLEFSKPSELELKDTNINQLLNETLDLLNNNLITRNIKVEKHLNDIPTIKADPNQLKQVFLNLLLNAIEAINHNGTITVSTGHVDRATGHVNITIKDTGCGIAKSDIPKLFDPFYTNKDSGTGLGLSVVHGIIEKHNGTIEVFSKINEWTEFIITL